MAAFAVTAPPSGFVRTPTRSWRRRRGKRASPQWNGGTDGSAVSLERGHLDVSSTFELGHHRSGCSHTPRHDGLRELLPFANTYERARKLAPPGCLGNQAWEFRVSRSPLRFDLIEKVPHVLYVYRLQHIVNDISCKISNQLVLGSRPAAPVFQPFQREFDFSGRRFLGPLLVHRQCQEDLAVTPLAREQEAETSGFCLCTNFVDVPAKMPRRLCSSVLHFPHPSCDGRNLLIGELCDECLYWPSSRYRSVVAPLPMESLRHR